MCRTAALQEANWLWDCCSKKSKMCGSAAVQGTNCFWDYGCKGSKLCVGLLL